MYWSRSRTLSGTWANSQDFPRRDFQDRKPSALTGQNQRFARFSTARTASTFISVSLSSQGFSIGPLTVSVDVGQFETRLGVELPNNWMFTAKLCDVYVYQLSSRLGHEAALAITCELIIKGSTLRFSLHSAELCNLDRTSE
jgi:hypothetical protein